MLHCVAKEAYTLIGDLVRSRRAADRPALHRRLRAVLDEANDRFAPLVPLRITVADEFQGIFPGLGAVVRAALHVRVAMLPESDVRHGIGWGEVSVLEEEPRVEDGPGWWAARAAIEEVAAAEQRTLSRYRRTAFRVADGAPTGAVPDPAVVEALLVLRDERVSGLSERSVSVLRGLLVGRTQKEIAAELGVSASAVSQRVRADGLAALVAADTILEEAR